MKRLPAAILLLSCCLLAVTANAQTVTGTISGHVLDSTGAVIANAKLEAKNEQTGLTRQATSNAEGYYIFNLLPPGGYRISASASGFAETVKTGVEVELNQTTASEFRLQPGAVAQQVTVTGEVPLVETTGSDVKATFDAKTIEDRPLPTRNFLYFAETVPGFQDNAVSGQNNPTASSGSSVNFNGTGTRGASFQINGVSNDDSSENQNRQGVNVSSIQQLQVLTNNFSAEFGRSYGTVVLVQTKQGTNRFHGDGYWFHTNTAMQAREFFTPSTFKVPPSRRHIFGGTVGGPILPNRLFFYGTYEAVRNGGGQTYERDFLFANEHQVDPSVTDPVDRTWIKGIIDSYPIVTPNDPAKGPRAFITGQKFHRPTYDFSGRMDWNVNTNNTFSARYQKSHQHLFSDQIIHGEGTNQNNFQHNLGVTLSHIYSNRQTGELRLAAARRETQVDIIDGDTTPIVRFANPNSPVALLGGTSTIGSAGSFPIHRFQTDWQFVYNHYWQFTPKIALKFGTDTRPSQLNDTADSNTRGSWAIRDDPVTGGVYHDAYYNLLHDSFGNGAGASFMKSYGPLDLANVTNEANFYEQLDMRLTRSFTLQLGLREEWVPATSERNRKISYGYSDSNNISPRLGFAFSPNWSSGWLAHVTGGPGKFVLRGGGGKFDGRLFQSYFSQNGASVRFSPPNGLVPSFDVSAGRPAHNHLGDPTQGFVFTPGFPTARVALVVVDPKMRTPYTEQWNLTMQREMPSRSSLQVAYVGNRGIGLPFYNITNRARFPFVAPPVSAWSPADQANGTAAKWAGVSFDCVDPNVQSANPISPSPGHQCISIVQPFNNFRRPDERFAGNFQIRNGNWSYYNALQMQWSKRATHGLAFQAGYTFGKALDTGSETTFTGLESNTPVSETDFSAMKGYSLFDVKHRFTLNYSYELPFWRDQHVHLLDQSAPVLGTILGRAFGGWQLSGTTIYGTGTPFSITAGYDLNGDGVNNDYPDLVDPSVLGRAVSDGHLNANGIQISTTQLLNTSFFPNNTLASTARPFRPGLTNRGTLSRNAFRTAGRNSWDTALQKNFRITEGQKLVFRWEAYNVMNHVQFGYPTGTTAVTTPANWLRITGQRRNRIDSDSGARYMQFAFRYVF